MNATAAVRQPAVAGAFYPGDPDRLGRAITDSFAAAVSSPDPEPNGDAPGSAGIPKAVIVPHAGYVYSGPIAASAYRRVALGRDSITRVVLLGPSHRVPLAGIAVTGAAAFSTPFGLVAIDAAARQKAIDASPLVRVDDGPHAAEHSLEVQLPFLQVVLRRFDLLPLAVGDTSADDVADVLDAVWGGPETLIVVSTDLSHYRTYDDAQQLDARTAHSIVAAVPEKIGDRDACGARPLRGLLVGARRRGLTIEQLDVRNSGDTAGDRDRVVGYGAFALA